MASRINKSLLKKETLKAQTEAIKKEAYNFARDVLEEKKQVYLNEIENHPVSLELKNGADGENLSKTLNGEGNLFSFIGFNQGDDPVGEVIGYIKTNTELKEISSKGGVFRFQVLTPNLDELKSITPMPFEGGNSWLKGIEKGISGFSNYLYGLIFPRSRSGRAIQTESRIRRGNYKPVKYFSFLYNKFIESFK